jgi:hypothetical protein
MSDQQENFEDTFNRERTEWTERIRELSIRMKNIREIAEVQVDLYSDRQKLLEYAYKLGQIVSRQNAKFRSDKRTKMIYYRMENQMQKTLKIVKFEATVVIIHKIIANIAIK